MGSLVLRAAPCRASCARAFQGTVRGGRRAGRVGQLLGIADGGRADQRAFARPATRKNPCSSSYLIGEAEALIRAANSSRKRRNPAASRRVAASITPAAASR